MSNRIEVELVNWRGYSAYEVAVMNGYKGTEEEWLESLKGRDGGVATVNGVNHDSNGAVVITGENIAVSKSNSKTIKQLAEETATLTGAISVKNDAIDVGGRYIDNARFR